MGRLCEDAPVPRPTKFLGKGGGPVGIAIALYDLWRRLPPKQRRKVLKAAREHAPRLAATLVKRRRR